MPGTDVRFLNSFFVPPSPLGKLDEPDAALDESAKLPGPLFARALPPPPSCCALIVRSRFSATASCSGIKPFDWRNVVEDTAGKPAEGPTWA